jgi:hypothetical protein
MFKRPGDSSPGFFVCHRRKRDPQPQARTAPPLVTANPAAPQTPGGARRPLLGSKPLERELDCWRTSRGPSTSEDEPWRRSDAGESEQAKQLTPEAFSVADQVKLCRSCKGVARGLDLWRSSQSSRESVTHHPPICLDLADAGLDSAANQRNERTPSTFAHRLIKSHWTLN